MYLKKLTLQGFKSFAARTSFEFGTGITTVVGPNGSGKSNVADAIRWVLGEQSARLLRAKRQDDVIFAGGGTKAAVGMAEVLLTLDNADGWLPIDFAEIEIGRRLYRNGDSEYLLNGSRVRLRDLVDLLMKGDVGQNSYTIMGQGLVDEVLLMSAEERRGLLDEAADVRRYRLRIKDAQDRLEATRSNLERVHLILGELEPRLTQLRRQAQRADEHSRLSAGLLDLLQAYYGQAWAVTQNSLARSRSILDQRAAENQAAAERVGALREQLRALGEEIRKRREALSRLETRNADLDTRIAGEEREIVLDRERHAMTVARQGELQAEVEATEAERAALAATDLDDGRRAMDIASQHEAAQARMAAGRSALEVAERDYATTRARMQELSAGLADDERRHSGLTVDLRNASRRLEEIGREDAQADARRRALLVELRGYGRRFAEALGAFLRADGDLGSSRQAATDGRARLARVEDEVRAFDRARQADIRELDRLEGRLEALRRVQVEHDGVAVGTRNVLVLGQALIEGVAPGSLGEPPEIPGVLGLLSRQLKVPAGLETAINAALEHRLHAVIVEREEQALLAIEALRTRRGGRAMLLPLDSVRHVYPLNLSRERGVIGVAARLVRCENRVRPLVDTLLGRIIIVEDIPTGLRMVRRGLGTVVTADGTLIEPNGIVSGGTTGAEEGPFLRQREVEELPEAIRALKERTASSADQLAQARAAVDQGMRSAREAERAYEGLLGAMNDARAALERERDRLHRLRREMDAVRARRRDIAREAAELRRLRETAGEALAIIETNRSARRGAGATIEQELKTTAERRDAALHELSEASGQLAAAEGERRALQAMREQHEHSLQRLANQVAARRLQARNLELEASVIAERLAGHTRTHEELVRARESRADDAAPDRDELHRLEAHERQVQDELNDTQADLLRVERSRLDLESEVARLSEQLTALRSELEREGLAPDRSGRIVPLEQAIESPAGWPAIQGGAEIDLEATRLQIDELRRQIRRLGPVNAEAPEDFRESEERFAFLTEQVADLTDAELQLRGVIAELNDEIRQRFGDAFVRVNAAFGDYFSAFFGGGAARLVLTDPEDLAATGLDIEAQPPGKRVRALSLLSGGERSLTAVALLFALLTVNPAPFCVLDEVDAALDEANVGRFTAALKELAERTQFLVVTHNRRTIEEAGAIYGVSMGRDGVSKVLSVRLDDLERS